MTDDPDDFQYPPADSVCPRCSQFVPHHQELERYLAAKRIKYYDARTGRVLTPLGRVRYCKCPAPETVRPRYAE